MRVLIVGAGAVGGFLAARLGDLIAGRHTEVEPVLGDLVERAEATATPAPLLALAMLALRIHGRQLEAAKGA
jgi:ketopantoate reductase